MSVVILLVSGGPIKGGWDWACSGGGGDKGAGDKFGGRIGSIDECKKVDVNEVVDKMGAKLERAAICQRTGIERRISCQRKGRNDSGRC